MLAVGRTLYRDGRGGGERGPRGGGRARGSASETGRTWSGPERTEGRDTAGKGRSVWTGKGWSGTPRADHVFSFREHGVSTDGHFGNGDFSALNRHGCAPCVSGRKREREGSGRSGRARGRFFFLDGSVRTGRRAQSALRHPLRSHFPTKLWAGRWRSAAQAEESRSGNAMERRGCLTALVALPESGSATPRERRTWKRWRKGTRGTRR